MLWIDEATVERILDADLALDAIEALFRAMAAGDAVAFDSVRDAIGYQDALFGNKSGFDRSTGVLGLKAGGYWPHNTTKGVPNHQSVTLVFDPETGRPVAAVSGNRLTARRTAAAAAVSIKHLARPDAATLGMIGAGAQAGFMIEAALAQRGFKRLLVANRTRATAEILANRFDGPGLEAGSADLETVCREADVLITAVSSFEPIVRSEWIGPGVHIAAMGADTAGKTELEPSLTARARVFTDNIRQSVTLGECEGAAVLGLLDDRSILPLEHVVASETAGRRAASDITLYDGTGLGLQDLAAARCVLDRAHETSREGERR